MKPVHSHDVMRERLLAGTPRIPPYEVLKRTQWCNNFEDLMRARLIMGAFRYGLLTENLKLGKRFNCLDSIKRRLALYEQDHNLEHLVDIANLALCQFVQDEYHGARLTPIDDGEHCSED